MQPDQLDNKDHPSSIHPSITHPSSITNLKNGPGDNISPHTPGDDKGILLERLAVQEIQGGVFCSQGQGGHGVHDQVDPQELHSLERVVVTRGHTNQ